MSTKSVEEVVLRPRVTPLVRMPEAGDEGGSLPFARLAAGVWRARYFVVAMLLLGAGIGLWLALATPDSYRSEGRFLFTSGSESIQLDLRRATENKAETLAAQAVHVLATDALLRRVVERMTPARVLAPFRPEPGAEGVRAWWKAAQGWLAGTAPESNVAEAVKLLRKRLVLEHPPLTNVLNASYVANDRQLAREVLSVYMEEARRWHQDTYDDPKVYERMQQQSAAAAVALAVAQRKRDEFLEREAQVASSFEFDLMHAQQNESTAASLLEQNAASLASIGRQVEELQRHLATIPATILVRRRLDAQRAADVYIAEIARLNAERARILAEAAGPAPEGIESIDRRLARLRDLLSADLKAQQNAPEIAVEERNPEYVETNQAIGRLASERVGNQAKAELLQQSHVAAAARARRLRGLEPRYVQLRADVLRAEETVRQAELSMAEAEQKRALRLGEFSSLSTIEDASLPLEKEGPERLRLILGAAAAGLFAALVLAVLRAMSDSVIRRPQDMEALDGVSVIGMMPKLSRRNLRRHAVARARGY